MGWEGGYRGMAGSLKKLVLFKKKKKQRRHIKEHFVTLLQFDVALFIFYCIPVSILYTYRLLFSPARFVLIFPTFLATCEFFVLNRAHGKGPIQAC